MNILIIGASSGIGKALYERYAKQGHRVGITGRRRELLDELQGRFPQNTIVLPADVTHPQETEEAFERFLNEVRHIDLAIVCAGTGDINPTLDYTLEHPTLATNVLGWTHAVDWLYRQFERQGNGHLAGITSVGGLRGEALAPAYSATKAYQINYLEALRKKAFKGGGRIHVTDIRPGFVDTAMAKGEGLFWVMPVEKAASQIEQAIRKQKSVVYVTRRWHLLAFLIRHLPFGLYKRM